MSKQMVSEGFIELEKELDILIKKQLLQEKQLKQQKKLIDAQEKDKTVLKNKYTDRIKKKDEDFKAKLFEEKRELKKSKTEINKLKKELEKQKERNKLKTDHTLMNSLKEEIRVLKNEKKKNQILILKNESEIERLSISLRKNKLYIEDFKIKSNHKNEEQIEAQKDKINKIKNKYEAKILEQKELQKAEIVKMSEELNQKHQTSIAISKKEALLKNNQYINKINNEWKAKSQEFKNKHLAELEKKKKAFYLEKEDIELKIEFDRFEFNKKEKIYQEDILKLKNSIEIERELFLEHLRDKGRKELITGGSFVYCNNGKILAKVEHLQRHKGEVKYSLVRAYRENYKGILPHNYKLGLFKKEELELNEESDYKLLIELKENEKRILPSICKYYKVKNIAENHEIIEFIYFYDLNNVSLNIVNIIREKFPNYKEIYSMNLSNRLEQIKQIRLMATIE